MSVLRRLSRPLGVANPRVLPLLHFLRKVLDPPLPFPLLPTLLAGALVANLLLSRFVKLSVMYSTPSRGGWVTQMNGYRNSLVVAHAQRRRAADGMGQQKGIRTTKGDKTHLRRSLLKGITFILDLSFILGPASTPRRRLTVPTPSLRPAGASAEAPPSRYPPRPPRPPSLPRCPAETSR